MSINSMTGFGESTSTITLNNLSKVLTIRVQIKSLNQRFIDINIKSPQSYSRFDLELNKICKSKLTRGKIDIQITRELKSESQVNKINHELITSLLEEVKTINNIELDKKEIMNSFLSYIWTRKDIFQEKDIDNSDISEEESSLLFKVFNESIESFIQSRLTEGVALRNELTKQVKILNEISKNILNYSKDQQKKLKENLEERIKQLNQQITVPEERIAQEICILVDKIDIREELVRLDSHLDLFITELDSKNAVGKKLEFVTQEIGREINTIGSKSSILEISYLVVEAKSVLERIREQIQNIE